ncbi:flagellar brake protein [Virgibacillus sp. FSP13]
MNIGTVLILETKEPITNKTRKLRCKVIEKNEHYIFIDYPIDEQTKKSTFLPKKTPFTVTYIGSDQSVYSFRSEIVDKVKLNIPGLIINTPEPDKIKRIQRREYVRIDVAVDVSIHSTEDSFEAFSTVTADISGGGLSIILPRGTTITEQEDVDVWFVLPMQTGDYQYLYAQSEVIRVITADNSVRTVSLKFTSISTQDRQQIIRFCFEKQREARNKELT